MPGVKIPQRSQSFQKNEVLQNKISSMSAVVKFYVVFSKILATLGNKWSCSYNERDIISHFTGASSFQEAILKSFACADGKVFFNRIGMHYSRTLHFCAILNELSVYTFSSRLLG